MRCLASDNFPSTYCPAMYPAPSTPAPMAKFVRFRRSHCRVDWIIVVLSRLRYLSFGGKLESRVGMFGTRARADVARHSWVDAMALRCAIITSISLFRLFLDLLQRYAMLQSLPSRKLEGAGEGAS